jgi:hypothetical protein
MRRDLAFLVLASLAASAVPLASACSGSTTQDLFAPQNTIDHTTPGTSGAPASSSGTSGSSGSSGASGTSGSGTSGSTGDAGDPGKDAGHADGSSGSHDAGPQTPGILCGTKDGVDVDCPIAAGSHCCAASAKEVPPFTFECKTSVNDPQNCPTDLLIECDDRTDCPAGNVCCGSLTGNPSSDFLQCQMGSSCLNIPPLQNASRFCDPRAAIDECVEEGKTCGPSAKLPGYGECQ